MRHKARFNAGALRGCERDKTESGKHVGMRHTGPHPRLVQFLQQDGEQRTKSVQSQVPHGRRDPSREAERSLFSHAPNKAAPLCRHLVPGSPGRNRLR